MGRVRRRLLQLVVAAVGKSSEAGIRGGCEFDDCLRMSHLDLVFAAHIIITPASDGECNNMNHVA